jgi:hypothetical protein
VPRLHPRQDAHRKRDRRRPMLRRRDPVDVRVVDLGDGSGSQISTVLLLEWIACGGDANRRARAAATRSPTSFRFLGFAVCNSLRLQIANGGRRSQWRSLPTGHPR